MDWTSLADAMQNALVGSALAEPVTVVSSDAVPVVVELRGIYERPPVQVNDGAIDYHGAEHRVTVKESELPAWVDRGTAVTIRGSSFVVVDRYPDGQGLVSLDLGRP